MLVKVRKVMKKKAPIEVCNLCGAVLKQEDLNNRFVIDRNIGEGSEYCGRHATMWMCCSCFDRLIEGCEITPIDQTKW